MPVERLPRVTDQTCRESFSLALSPLERERVKTVTSLVDLMTPSENRMVMELCLSRLTGRSAVWRLFGGVPKVF